jgi:hypothetical protein
MDRQTLKGEIIFINNPYYFKEDCITNVFDCLNPIDIPQAFPNNNFLFLEDYFSIQGTIIPFHNKIYQLKEIIIRKLKDPNVLIITLDG